mmetsp:Transcript_8923/g.16218  ORF Transcript_8923/g.16218 Transcript_8923/m.16218 type:complete len:161 (-) Transcript_8923:34-516(-)
MDGMLACTGCCKQADKGGEVMVAVRSSLTNGYDSARLSLDKVETSQFKDGGSEEAMRVSQIPDKTEGPQGQYMIQLTKRPNSKKVNIDVDYGDGKTLKVRRVKRPGLLNDFNELNAHQRVDEGDVFMVINGKFGDSKTLLHELLNSPTLDILVKKHRNFS